ncbi:Prefoldin beta-like protein [Glomus cerebriforme]|uniref:Prefoldin subunit 4 n=1 Tax=Glomus cerebriforme TaxID=658196 RepID=A0A397TIQ0_9GLOM|nr:Prefoldin beta-like protein [Glomus cerebriforme]
MRMLNQEEEVDAEVTWEDQQRINSFSKLNAKYSDLETTYESKKQEKGFLDDLTEELELADEDELIKYKIGEAFINISVEQAQQRIEKDKEILIQELEQLQHEMNDLNGQMSQLKVHLYGKFGKAINLEKD